jgi:thioredoxin-like negative regulator of GroEL
VNIEYRTLGRNVKLTTEINKTNFEIEVLTSSRPMLVEFAMGWSLPSMMTNGAMDEIAVEFVDCLQVGGLKLDRSPNLGLCYGIRCLPTIVFQRRRGSRRNSGTTSTETTRGACLSSTIALLNKE